MLVSSWSTWVPIPHCFILLATLPSLPGSSMRTSLLLLKPPGTPSCLTAICAPWVSASLRPPVASDCDRSPSDSAKALADSSRPAHRPVNVRERSSMDCVLFSSRGKRGSLLRRVQADLHRRFFFQRQVHSVALGADQQQLAIDLDPRADGIGVTGLYLLLIVGQVKRQRHLAFDRAILAGEGFRRCVSQ